MKNSRKKKKKSPAKIKKALKKRCDILWSSITKQIHRHKHGDICGWCKKPSDELQSDHIVNRWKHSTRWNVDNCIVLDKICHIFQKKRDPMGWSMAVLEHIGEEKYEALKSLGNTIMNLDLQSVYDGLSALDREKPWTNT